MSLALKVAESSKDYCKTYEFKRLNILKDSISRINHLLLHVKKESDLYHKVTEILYSTGEYLYIWIGLFNEQKNRMNCIAASGLRDYLPVINNYANSINPEKNFFNSMLEQQKEIIINDMELHPCSSILNQESGSIGYESFASLPLRYKKEIVGTLNIYSAKKNSFNGAELKFIKEVSNDISIGIRSIRYEKELEKNYINTKRVLYETINSIALISERRDPYTAGHQKRVATLTRAIAKELKLDEKRSEGIYFISILHDIGKMSIPLSILSKPACLSKAEIMLIQSHSREGYDMLKNIEFPWPVAQTILQHHERLDGSGYPYGLKENEISLESRILAVADIIEAMSSHRPYRPAIGLNKALKELERNSGILYDSKIVSICTDLFRNKRFKF